MTRLLTPLFIAILTAALACSDDGARTDGGKAPGTLGGPCRAGGACGDGLTCAGGRCVQGADAGAPDGPVTDAAAAPDAMSLRPCDTPGSPCVASDPCAITAVCGNDKRCRAATLQKCDDGFACTTDGCLGLGVCSNTPKVGFCLIGVKQTGGGAKLTCLKKGAQPADNDCLMCDDTQNPATWTALSGFSCDDGDACTQGDKCSFGICAGVSYADKCADDHACTQDLCDGLGGCKAGHPLKSGWCQINNLCYQDKATDLTGCKMCDAASSQTGWTALASKCLVDGKCYPPKALKPVGCGVCDPAVSATSWSPILTPTCVISGACYPAKAVDTTGCGKCDPAKSATTWTIAAAASCLVNRTCHASGKAHGSGCASCVPATSASGWTPAAGKCLIGGACYSAGQSHSSKCLACDATQPDRWSAKPGSGSKISAFTFEGGALAGWTINNSDATVGWMVSDRRSTGGGYALYYGSGAAGNYLTAGSNKGAATLPAVTLTAGKQAGLSFSLWMDTETSSKYDLLQVKVNGTPVWGKSTTTVPAMRTWQQVTVPLAASGSPVTIQFEFDTVDAGLNATEGIHIDDITIYENCSPI